MLLFLFFLASILKSQFYQIFSKPEVKNEYKQELASLAGEALRTNDVPVGAIVVYDGNIIGRGYNTVFRNSEAGGHAEINAISDAMKTVGVNNFMNLNRDSLELISTFEPCEMCKGAIRLYRIKHVEFLESKPYLDWLGITLSNYLYEFHKRQMEPSELQDSLFEMHPDFKSQRFN